jgi:hypothetical protein
VIVPYAADLSDLTRVREEIAAYRDAGVTGMTVSFRSESLEEHLEGMEAFAGEVMEVV